MRPLILMSGGLDSTTLLYDHLLRGDEVDVLYAECGQHENKISAEKRSVNRILEICNDLRHKRYLKGMVFSQHEGKFTWSGRGPTELFAFSQPMPWLVTALQYVRPRSHNQVEIAYCMGDQISSEIYRLQEIWKLMWAVVVRDEYPLVPLVFPFARQSKQEFLNRLPSYLRDVTWVYELPREVIDPADPQTVRMVACGSCTACVRSEFEKEFYPRHSKQPLRQDVYPDTELPSEDDDMASTAIKPNIKGEEFPKDTIKKSATSVVQEIASKGYYDNCPTFDHDIVDVVHLAAEKT